MAVTPAPAKAADKTQHGSTAKAPTVPFREATTEHIEDTGLDVTFTPGASSKNLGTFPIPAFGYLRAIVLDVEATGGSGTGTAAVATADAPWSVVDSIEVDDTNGQPFYGPLSGYDAYLVSKWCQPIPSDPAAGSTFSAMDTGGNFSFLLRIPVEIVPRDGIGALSNLNGASLYRVKVSGAPASSVYATSPAPTVPSVRVQAWAEEYTEPLATDPFGRAQAQEPPSLGTTMEFSTQDIDLSSGSQTPKFTRVGNAIRAWVLVGRNAAGARAEGVISDPFTLYWDGREVATYHLRHLQQIMRERWPGGYSRDAGVYVLDFAHEASGKFGDEFQECYLRTTTGSRIELRGSGWGAGVLHVITNDVLSFAGASPSAAGVA